MTIAVVMAQATRVFAGPSSAVYAPTGKVGVNESVSVLGKEKGWLNIEYSVGMLKKRGYVPDTTVLGGESVANNISDRHFPRRGTVTSQTATVYSGPSSSRYASTGLVPAGESLTKFNETSGGYCYIEYNSPSGKRRGYVLIDRLKAGGKSGICAEQVTS